VTRSLLLGITSTVAVALAQIMLVPAATAATLQAPIGDDTREPVVAAAPSAAQPPSAPSADGTRGTRYRAAIVPAALPATARASRYLGPALSGQVVAITPAGAVDPGDPAAITVQWRHNASRTRLPASTQKVLTAFTVLRNLDPTGRLTTTVNQDAIKRDRVYLRGGADPSLTRARLAVLARDTAAVLARQGRTRVAVYVDGSLLPRATPAPGWKASYLRSDVQPVQGLPLAGHRGPDAAATAGRLFAVAMTRHGIRATYRGAGRTPGRPGDLALSRSAPISSLVATMLATSNNDYAEFLLRHATIGRGATPSWSGSIAMMTRTLADAGIPTGGLRIADGSGLSRANRMPVATLAAVLTELWTDPDDAAVAFAWGAMPRAGQSGTLVDRYRLPQHSCAQGLVLAKTGTLTDAVALARAWRGAWTGQTGCSC
jgi:D-alanyl-D-alanine carboxypeptidase/D-alanyl-D-alanine-endopeptidase (penicillin-binding protein 4)